MSEVLAQLEKKGGGSSGGLLVRNPVLTSNTGQAAASSAASSSNAAWCAFTGDNSTRWAPAQSGESNAWVSFHFSEKLHPKLACIMTRNEGSASSCSNLVFECSNDGSNWVSITSELSAFYSGASIRTYQLLVTENASAYAYFRVRGTFSYAGNGFKIQFFGEK